MNEFAAMQAALTSIRTATDIAKVLRTSTTSLKDAEINFKLAELLTSLADAKTELAHVQETILEQNTAIRELNEKLAFKANMKFERPYYWNLTEDGKQDGPYCQPCWDEKRLAVRLYGGHNGEWMCRVCNKHFHDATYKPPPPPPRRGGSWMGV